MRLLEETFMLKRIETIGVKFPLSHLVRTFGKTVIVHKPWFVIFTFFSKKTYLVVHDQPERYLNAFWYEMRLIRFFPSVELIVYTELDRLAWEASGYSVAGCCLNPVKNGNSDLVNDKGDVLYIYYGRIQEDQKRVSRLLAVPRKELILFGSLGINSDLLINKGYKYCGTVEDLDVVLESNKGKYLIALLCSDHEGLPLSIFELLARNIPVISTCSSPGIDWLSRNVSGLKLIPFDFKYEDIVRVQKEINRDNDFRDEILKLSQMWKKEWINIFNDK